MDLTSLSCEEFAEALASKAPVPGGGGAAALVGALAASLGSMVCNFTLGKPKYAAAEGALAELLRRAESLRAQLLECVNEDAKAFEPLSRAYAIPKDDPVREAVTEECLRGAAAPPMKLLRLSCEGIELHRELSEKGSALIVSDAGTGVILFWAALYAAALNVKANTKLMVDREYAEAMNAEVDSLAGEYWQIAEKVYASVYGRFS